jgi:hypothetical protein
MEKDEDTYDYDMTLNPTPMDTEDLEDVDMTLVDSLVDISNTNDLEESEDESSTTDRDDVDYEEAIDVNSGSNTNKPTAGWSEDTVQTEEMSRLGICVNTTEKVVVCITCSCVIKPFQLPHHLSKTHPPMSTTTAFCQELTNAFGLHEDPLGSRPGRIIPAIYGLELFNGYLSCDKCGYACRTKKRMKIHVGKSTHCNTYRPRYVQSFCSNSNQMFFGVGLQETPVETEDPPDPVAFLKNKYMPVPFSQVPIKSQAACDTSQFLNLEHWDKHLEGRLPTDIHKAVRGREPELRTEVRLVVERFAENAVKKLEKLDHEAKGAMGDYLG